jgi:hypothetical protein
VLRLVKDRTDGSVARCFSATDSLLGALFSDILLFLSEVRLLLGSGYL